MSPLRLALASSVEREAIYRLRHAVYATELGQHSINNEGCLRDALDGFNEYIVAAENSKIAGFVSLTPPGQSQHGELRVCRIAETLAWVRMSSIVRLNGGKSTAPRSSASCA